MNNRNNSFSAGSTTDVVVWMRESGPQNLGEIGLLESGLRGSTARRKLFMPEIVETQSGRTLCHIKGHSSTLVLASEKHAQFFREVLKQRKKRMQIDRKMQASYESARKREVERYEQFVAENGPVAATPNDPPWL